MGFKDFISGLVGAPEYEEEDKKVDDMEPVISKPKHQMHTAADIKKNDKIVNINATTQLQVILVKPERFDDGVAIADHLNSKKTVLLNLESTDKEAARRLIDFLSGVAYANNGQLKKVAKSTFIITPYNVDIMGELIDELENNGVYF